MWLSFYYEHFRFAVYILLTLTMLAVFWLYLDAWIVRKKVILGIKVLGFLLLAISFLLQSTILESSVLAHTLLPSWITGGVGMFLRIAGYIAVVIGLVFDPLQKRPNEVLPGYIKILNYALLSLSVLAMVVPQFGMVVLACIVCCLYVVRSTIGLERHLMRVGIGFGLLGLGELLQLHVLWRGTMSADLYYLVAAFGWIWIAEHILLLCSSLMLGSWVLGYLLKRIHSQLMIAFTLMAVILFFATSITFSTILMKDVERERLNQLQSNARALELSLQSRKDQLISYAEMIAKNPNIADLLSTADPKPLKDMAEDLMITQKLQSLVIVSEKAQVVARGEDRDRIGDSLSSHPLIQRALREEGKSSIKATNTGVYPVVVIEAAAPLVKNNKVVGAVLIGSEVNTSFVDNVKSSTGFDVSVYGDNVRSATTFIGPDGHSRWVGIKESNREITERVLKQGLVYTCESSLLNVPYYSAVLPLKDIDNVPVGMLFVGVAQTVVLQAAARSIELTFVSTVILLLLAFVPCYFISRSIAAQVRK